MKGIVFTLGLISSFILLAADYNYSYSVGDEGSDPISDATNPQEQPTGLKFTFSVTTGMVEKNSRSASADGYNFDHSKRNTPTNVDTITPDSTASPSGSTTGSKIYVWGELPASSFTMAMSGKLTKSGGSGGTQPSWSASAGNQIVFEIKSNKDDGAKSIVVPAGETVTYTAYKDASSWSSHWILQFSPTGGGSHGPDPISNASSITFGASLWQTLSWGTPEITPPLPGEYTIKAYLNPTGTSTVKDEGGSMVVVGLSKVAGHGKESTLKEAPASWDDAQIIYATPGVTVDLTATLDRTVTMNDLIRNAISWGITGGLTITPNVNNRLEASVVTPLTEGTYTVTARCGSSERVILIKALLPELTKVTFNSDITVQKDSGGNYDKIWDSAKSDADQSPIAFTKDAISDPNMGIAAKPELSAPEISGTRITYDVYHPSYSVQIEGGTSTTATYSSGKYTATTASEAIITNGDKVYYTNNELTWRVIPTGMQGSWVNVGDSKNDIYFTYGDVSSAYETVLDVSCKSALGKSSLTDRFVYVWEAFRATNNMSFTNRSGNSLYYYNDYTCTYNNLSELLEHRDGTCFAWRTFFTTSLQTQEVTTGVTNKRISANYKTSSEFLIKTWDFSGGGSSGDADFPYLLGLTVYPASYVYTAYNEVTYTTGTQGKNNNKPDAFFAYHFLIQYGTNYYDPSYGVMHTSDTSIDNTISGFVRVMTYTPPTRDFAVQNPSGVQISITNN